MLLHEQIQEKRHVGETSTRVYAKPGKNWQSYRKRSLTTLLFLRHHNNFCSVYPQARLTLSCWTRSPTCFVWRKLLLANVLIRVVPWLSGWLPYIKIEIGRNCVNLIWFSNNLSPLVIFFNWFAKNLITTTYCTPATYFHFTFQFINFI